MRAGQSQHIGQALLTTGAAEWLTLSSDKVTRQSLLVANKVIDALIPVVGRLVSTLGPGYVYVSDLLKRPIQAVPVKGSGRSFLDN
jgi:hypothetical protein